MHGWVCMCKSVIYWPVLWSVIAADVKQEQTFETETETETTLSSLRQKFWSQDRDRHQTLTTERLNLETLYELLVDICS